MVRTRTSTTTAAVDGKPAVKDAGVRELDALKSGLGKLAKRLWILKNELKQLVGYVKVALERGYGLEYVDEGIKILRSDSAGELDTLCLFLEMSYIKTQQDLAKVFELRKSLLKSFAELPQAIVAKLPLKNGAPWRSFYLRECLDILNSWPREVQKAIPYLDSEMDVPNLITAMSPSGPRPGFPLHEHFERFGLILESAVQEIDSLRFEFAEPKRKTQDEKTKKMKPNPGTLVVIRIIEKGKSNDQVQKLLKEKHKTFMGIPAIKKIRSRLKLGRYVL